MFKPKQVCSTQQYVLFDDEPIQQSSKVDIGKDQEVQAENDVTLDREPCCRCERERRQPA